MRKLLVVILLLFCATTYGQKIRFTDTSNKWTINISHPDKYYFISVSSTGFDTINGNVYSRLDGMHIREDSFSNKVYVRFVSTSDTAEHVLYDYNLVTGDTFTFTSDWGGSPIDSYVHVVNALDSTMINGVWHRVWDMKNIYFRKHYNSYYYPGYLFIEGIGCLRGLFFPTEPGLFELTKSITCFSSHSTNPLLNPKVGYFDNKQSCELAITNIAKENKSVTITPNPANEHSKIIFPYTIQSGNLYITNMLGQVVIQRSIVNSEQVYLGNGINAEGVYFYEVTDNQTGQSFTGKFIYQ